MDWQVARGWYEQGVPLELVEHTVRELFERRRVAGKEDKVWSLGHCKRSVDAAWKRQQKLQAPGAAEDDDRLDLSARLDNLASALPAGLEDLQALAGRIRGLEGDAEAIEKRLAAIDHEIVGRAREGLADSERAEIEGELAASRKALAARLPADELERAQERLREEILRRRLSLPVLSLFAPEATEPAEA